MAKKKYKVSAEISLFREFVIEAENGIEAEKIAKERIRANHDINLRMVDAMACNATHEEVDCVKHD